jgi:Recombination endonuclease VII
LCGNCNTMLGMAGDRVEVLQAAIDYLRGRCPDGIESWR